MFMIKMAIHMLFVEKKKLMSFIYSLSATFVVCLLFIQFFTNPYLKKVIKIGHKVVFDAVYALPEDVVKLNDNFIVILLSFVLLVICISLISYSCYYHCLMTSREIGLLKLSGYNLIQIIGYKMIQMVVVMSISLLISNLVYLFLNPLFLYLIKSYLKIEMPLILLNKELYEFLFMIVGILFIFIVFLETRYALSTNICELLTNHTMNHYKEDKRILKIPDTVYIIAYMLGILTMYSSHELDAGFSIAACIGAIGAYGMFYYFIPHTILDMFDDLKLSGEKYVALGDVSVFMQQSKSLIVYIMLSVILFPTFILVTTQRPFIFMILQIAFILINILLSTSLMNRFFIDLYEKKNHYSNLFKIGLNRKEVIQVSTQQGNYFYGLFWIFTLIYMFCIISVFYLKTQISLSIILCLVLEYMIPYLISQIVVYMSKRRNTL